MSETTTLGVFGGSFNPPHVAHLLAVTYVLATQPVDRVVVVPCYDHPLGKSLAPFAHRKAMCELAFGDVARVEVSSIEQEMGATSRTIYTLQELLRRDPACSLRLIVGADILHEKDKWYAWDEIERLAPPIVLGRIGFDDGMGLPRMLPEVASREVRARMAKGEDVSAVVPRAVIEYARRNGLYAEAR